MADAFPTSGGSHYDQDLDEYRQVYLDETEEELEALVQSLLKLEKEPQNLEALNDAFRLLHTMKGTSGLMGYEGVSELAHHLENRFERLRSHEETLTRDLMNLILKATDFLRDFNNELRKGNHPDGNSESLIHELDQIQGSGKAPAPAAESFPLTQSLSGAMQVHVKFVDGLQLADLKARLIMARLGNIGEVIGSVPAVDEITSLDQLPQLTIILSTDQSREQILKIANVDGVESVEIIGAPSVPKKPDDSFPTINESFPTINEAFPTLDSVDVDSIAPALKNLEPKHETPVEVNSTRTQEIPPAEAKREISESETEAVPSRPVTETVRVEVPRLDRLMNLTGELLVANAHFAQVTAEMLPCFKRGASQSRLRDFSDRLRRRLGSTSSTENEDDLLSEFLDDLDLLDRQTSLWEESRRQFAKIAESVDQLSRLSNNLQKRVLDTRMVPVGPLFSRFKRVVRDLAGERNKQVQLIIKGERTELDKRMIDELGDPLLHLIRNSIDHGLETAEQRRECGKREVGTITLEARHRGNSVFIEISDDGAGLSLEKISRRAVQNKLVSESELSHYSESQIFEFIWKPGFSTASEVTDISGRGVGMDIVKSRINDLSGSVSVTSRPKEGTTFSLRLPLTLAIIRSLMVRFRSGVFSMPLDDVREIVSVPVRKIRTVSHRETIEVRGQFIPLVRMDRIFSWNRDDEFNDRPAQETATETELRSQLPSVNVVILQSSGRVLGLCVDELLGGANIVIKSLTENFQNIYGLSGASVKGDGSVCLMLDTSALFELASRSL